MAINPYAGCPCGSGKQFKWCCQPYYGLVDKALAMIEKGQHAAADQAMSQLVEKNPKVAQAWGYQAEVLLLNEKSAAAEVALQKAFDLEPNFAYGFWLRGLMRLQEGEGIGGLLLFRKAAEFLDPNAHDLQSQVNTRVGELELQFNRPVAARAALTRALNHGPQNQELKQAFDSVFGPESRLPESARKGYTFRPAPADKAERWRPALEAAATGKLSDALKAFEGIAESDPTDPTVEFNLGLVHAWLGNNPRAVEALNRSIDRETEEDRLVETGALAEVLRCGLGMEAQTDHIEHRALLQIRDAEPIGKALSEWNQAGRLIVVNADREQGVFSALFLEDVPNLGIGIGSPVARLLAYFVLAQDTIRLWHPHRAMLDKAVEEIRGKLTLAVAEPQYDSGVAQFGDVVAEVMMFPAGEGTDQELVAQKMRDGTRAFFEETWARRPLKSLDGRTPQESAADPAGRKRLPGLLRFMEECLEGVNPLEGNRPALYDFDRLRRKLGLATAPPAAGAELDFETLSREDLDGLDPTVLTDEQVERAFRAGQRLDAPFQADRFAANAVARPTVADRYPFFNHLVKTARDEGKTDDVIRLLTEGEQADAATNEGRRRVDYVLARGQALARSGDAAGAFAVFKELVAGPGVELSVFATAAETMLGRKQGPQALEFAEAGLKEARTRNSRDGEQQFLELVAAAKKQTG